jgi:hypothetical protein
MKFNVFWIRFIFSLRSFSFGTFKKWCTSWSAVALDFSQELNFLESNIFTDDHLGKQFASLRKEYSAEAVLSGHGAPERRSSGVLESHRSNLLHGKSCS